ncbi:MAG TPA: alcohol dehydrogenase catalytic domain-containing protein, partial [Aggregatilineales bacterium]|nr:alcohol dehydrogenase catalytic domain-containing protein [Aggregatilineales bacterium]
MKAAYLHGARDIRIGEAPVLEPGDGDLVVDVTAVGICGSDLHSFLYGQIGEIAVPKPLILGHEAAGVVVGRGTPSFKVGQLVALDPCIACGHCEQCERGRPHLCSSQHFLGL